MEVDVQDALMVLGNAPCIAPVAEKYATSTLPSGVSMLDPPAFFISWHLMILSVVFGSRGGGNPTVGVGVL